MKGLLDSSKTDDVIELNIMEMDCLTDDESDLDTNESDADDEDDDGDRA